MYELSTSSNLSIIHILSYYADKYIFTITIEYIDIRGVVMVNYNPDQREHVDLWHSN